MSRGVRRDRIALKRPYTFIVMAMLIVTLPTPHKVVEIPSTALLADAKGVRVAIVEGGKLHLVPIVIERDTGPTLEIGSGLEGNEKVVKLASAELVEGRPVDVK